MFLCLLKNAAFSNKLRVSALGCRPWGGRCFPGVWTWVISALGEERRGSLSAATVLAQFPPTLCSDGQFFISLSQPPPPQLESVNTRGLKQVGEINFNIF